jgi:hypothetical protein
MKEELITFETAKLAKEKGFQLGSKRAYVKYKVDYNYDNNPYHVESYKKGDTDLFHDFYMMNGKEGLGDLSNENYDLFEAPTQSLLQKWLRKKHNIDIDICPGWNSGKRIYECLIHQGSKDKYIELSIKDDLAGSYELIYEEALETGLQEALKLINNENN